MIYALTQRRESNSQPVLFVARADSNQPRRPASFLLLTFTPAEYFEFQSRFHRDTTKQSTSSLVSAMNRWIGERRGGRFLSPVLRETPTRTNRRRDRVAERLVLGYFPGLLPQRMLQETATRISMSSYLLSSINVDKKFLKDFVSTRSIEISSCYIEIIQFP